MNSGMPASANIGSTEPRSWRRNRLNKPRTDDRTDETVDVATDERQSVAMCAHPLMWPTTDRAHCPPDAAALWLTRRNFLVAGNAKI